MNPYAFEHLCKEILTLTSEQHECLQELLKSRIWLYEKTYIPPEFERIFSFEDSSIKIILREIPQETLILALKGASADLRKRFYKNMTKVEAARLEKKLKALGPTRLSICHQAIEEILEILNVLASKGEIELPPPLGGISYDFSDQRKRKAPEVASKNEFPEEPPTAIDMKNLMASYTCTTVCVRNNYPKLRMNKDGAQTLTFDTREGEFNINIDDATLRQLGQLCAPYAHQSNGEGVAPDFDEARRLQTRVLFTLPDYVWMALMREVEVSHWVGFLWYLNDAHLTHKVFALSTPHFANTLKNNLAARQGSQQSEADADRYSEQGQLAIRQILGTLYQLADEGQVYLLNR